VAGAFKPYTPAAVSFRQRSPYSAPYLIGLPPARLGAPDVRMEGGQPMVGGVPLAVIQKSLQEFLFNTAAPETVQERPVANFSAQQYGDSGSIRIDLVAGTPQRALKRPINARVELLIQNLNIAGVVSYDFDNAPSVTSSIQIPALGNRLWDAAVPQGDLWMICPVAAVVIVEFINKDLSNPRA